MGSVYERVQRIPQRRMLLWGFICISIFFIYFTIFSDERESRRDYSIRTATSYMEGFRIVSKKDGADALVITARRADFSKDETLAKMDAVTMDIKKEGVVLNADRGTYNMDTKDLTLEDNITIEAKGSVIYANTLSWNPAQGMLTSEGKVRIKGNKFTAEGEGLTATQDSRVKLMRNVKAIFN